MANILLPHFPVDSSSELRVDDALPPLAVERKAHRRQRSREISSRYMIAPTPIKPNLPSPTPLSERKHHHHQKLDSNRSLEALADENLSYRNSRIGDGNGRKRATKLFTDISGDERKGDSSEGLAGLTPRSRLAESGRRSVNRESKSAPSTPWRQATSVNSSPEERTIGSETDGFSRTPQFHLRSSMPEPDFLPKLSSRRPANCHESIVHRSLNSVLSNCQKTSFNPASKTTRSGPNVRQEDTQSIGVLVNHHLQWRFINAKADAASNAKKINAERLLHGASAQIFEHRDFLVAKKMELQTLQRTRKSSTILENQITKLEEWEKLEKEHSSSFSKTLKALWDTSIRVPIIGNIKVDPLELSRVLDSAGNTIDSFSRPLFTSLHKSEEKVKMFSDLARVVLSERELLQECGNALYLAHKLQVIESGLRSQVILLKTCLATCESKVGPF